MKKKLICLGAVMLFASALQMEAKKAPPTPGYPTYSQWMYGTTCGKVFYGEGPDAFPSQEVYLDYLLSMNELLCGTGGIPEVFERPTPSNEPDPHGVKPTPQEKTK